jgi:hypothetical protein
MVIFHSYVSLPEGNHHQWEQKLGIIHWSSALWQAGKSTSFICFSQQNTMCMGFSIAMFDYQRVLMV